MDKIDYFPLECGEVIDSIALIIKEIRLSHPRCGSRMLPKGSGSLCPQSAKSRLVIEKWSGERCFHVLWQLGALKDVIAVDRAQLQKSELSSRRVRLPSFDKEDF
jgi:hypothetical protein